MCAPSRFVSVEANIGKGVAKYYGGSSKPYDTCARDGAGLRCLKAFYHIWALYSSILSSAYHLLLNFNL